MRAKFGPAGNSDRFSKEHKSSLAAPQWIADFGLDCYEIGRASCRERV